MKTTLYIISAMFMLMLYPFIGEAQRSRTISGKIMSVSTGQAIEGVTITNKASGEIVISDQKGAFHIRAFGQSDTLAFSSVGYEVKEIAASDIESVSIEIYLKEATNLLVEVTVNTGYQSLPKERATGSFTHISNDLFNRSVSTDLISRLEGVTNGLSYELPVTRDAPSSVPALRLRGLSTINGTAEPLIVIDNFPYEGDINNINPNDVSSITILKDAAAASIWGARAGNGVIVVTTKNGAESGRPIVNFNSNATVANRPDLNYSRSFLPPSELVELERALFDRGVYVKNDWTAFTPAVEILFSLEEGGIDATTADRMLEDLKRYDVRSEASKYLYRQSLNQQYALNIGGGSRIHRYYVSGGFDNNAGNLVGNDYKRITMSVKNDFQLLPKLDISTSVNYMQGSSFNNGISMLSLAPSGMSNPYVYARLADENGNPLSVVRNNRLPYTESAIAMGLLDWRYRPLDELKLNDNSSAAREVRLNAALKYRILEGLSVGIHYQYQVISNASRNHYESDSYFARHLINQYTQEGGEKPIPVGGVLDKSGSKLTAHYGRAQIDYKKNWGQIHEILGLVGSEIRQESNAGDGSSRLYGYDDRVLTHSNNLNYEQFYPLRPNSFGSIPNGNSPGRQFLDRFVSYYGNAGYTFKERYTFSASARWDASNIFGVDFNQKGVPLWSMGMAWNVSDERFFNMDWIDMAKLRATYGANGNVVRSLSSLPYISYAFTNTITRLPAGRMISIGNPDLSWEKVNVFNLGLDIATFGNRLSGSIEWYTKKSQNLIGADFFDPTVGIFPSGSLGNYNLDNLRNYADMSTRGIDVELNTVNIDNVFKWQTTFLISHVTNTITNYKSQQNLPVINFLGASGIIPVVEGVSKDQLYALPWYGLDNEGAPQVMVDGRLTTDYNTYFNSLTYEDLDRIGVSKPPYFGSIRNTFTWRSFSASINVIWKGGHMLRRGTLSYASLLSPGGMTHIDYLDRWQQPGDELITNIPSMPESVDLRRDQAYMFSQAVFEKGDNIRLQDVSVSWEFPQKYIGIIGLSRLRLYTYARNLGILWKHTNYDIDPDVSALYPHPFQLAFGLQIQL